jgi:sigma-B regulation protein RsbU (phosphoserine phosphatase)
MARLTAVRGTLTGQSFELGDEIFIGRLSECAVTIDDQGVSRKHARIWSAPEGVFVEDLMSSNGTIVNGREIDKPVLLRDQDTIAVYGHTFRFEAGPEAAAPAQVADEFAATFVPPRKAAAQIMFGDADAMAATIEETFDMGATMVDGVFVPPAAGDAATANQRLQTILRISNALQTELELDALLDDVLANLFQVFDLADRGFLMLYDEGGELRPAACRNRQGQSEEVRVSRSIINEVTSRRVAVLSSDALTDDRFGGAMSIADLNIRSVMCAPLLTRDELLGVIHVDTVRPGNRFFAEDLELLSGVAAQTALAIAGARMHEELLARDRVERDLKVATQVQNSFLPASTPDVPGLEFAAFYRAALDIGGDLYDFVPQSGDSMAIVVGDVSGKGVPAALMMARMSSDARFYAVQEREPRDILPHLSRRMDETGMADVFVTMLLATLDLQTHRMLVANAAHCRPLVRRAAEGDVMEMDVEPGFALGMMPGSEYAQASYGLQPGDVVCLVTDGVTEAMNSRKEQYGEERLRATVAAAPPSAQGVLAAILADVEEHVGDTKQSDDLTCVCFGVSAGGDDPLVLEMLDED